MKRHLFLALFLTIATPWAASAVSFTLNFQPTKNKLRTVFVHYVATVSGGEVTYLGKEFNLNPDIPSKSFSSGTKDKVAIKWEDGATTYFKALSLGKRDWLGSGVFTIKDNGGYSQTLTSKTEAATGTADIK